MHMYNAQVPGSDRDRVTALCPPGGLGWPRGRACLPVVDAPVPARARGVVTACACVHTCARPHAAGLDLDFVEIGTSNFETLIQLASEDSKGLSVEGLKMYQDQLPDKPNVQKVNAAISSEYQPTRSRTVDRAHC